MRKFILLISGFFLFEVLFFAGSANLGQTLPGFKTHRSKNLRIEFNYPEILKVLEKDGVITIQHTIKFKHRDPCSENEDRLDSKEIYDFYAKIAILNKTPTEIFRKEIMEVNDNGLVVGIKNSVRVTYGELDGFRIYNGNHECGLYSYFFQLADEKVLRVDRYPAPEFREVPESDKQIYNRLRQIILPEQEEHIFREILFSLTTNE